MCPTPKPAALFRRQESKRYSEFKAWKHPDGVPSNPNLFYKNKGLEKSWFEFFGREQKKSTRKYEWNWLPYVEAQKIVQKARVKTPREFYAWKRPDGVPSNPHMTYKGKGWKSYPEFFGREPERRQS